MSDVERTATGIEGFDFISGGGVPKGRTTLIAGAAGTGKTVFCLEFALHGLEQAHEPVVYVPFEESPGDLRRTAGSFGWDLQAHEDEGRLRFVDAVPRTEGQTVITGAFDLGALMSRIDHAIAAVGARRVVIDAVSTLFSYLPDPARIRWEMFRLRQALREANVTALVTAERDREDTRLTRNGVEAFVNDNVVVLRNRHDRRQRQRTISIAKFRAAGHLQGEVPFTIRSDRGMVIAPLSAMELEQQTPDRRRSTGVAALDDLTGGGLFETSSTLVSGATGTGKTLLSCHFQVGMGEEERGLFFGFEESRTQVLRDARGWGLDLEGLQAQGRLQIDCEYPERFRLEEHLIRIKDAVDEFQPTRVSVDSLTALQRIGTLRSFREFVLGLISFLKSRGVTLLMTSTTSTSREEESVTATHVSSVADGIILLRYLERPGSIDRALAILKLRGTRHDRAVHSYDIDDSGLQLGEPLDVPANILGDGMIAYGGRLA